MNSGCRCLPIIDRFGSSIFDRSSSLKVTRFPCPFLGELEDRENFHKRAEIRENQRRKTNEHALVLFQSFDFDLSGEIEKRSVELMGFSANAENIRFRRNLKEKSKNSSWGKARRRRVKSNRSFTQHFNAAASHLAIVASHYAASHLAIVVAPQSAASHPAIVVAPHSAVAATSWPARNGYHGNAAGTMGVTAQSSYKFNVVQNPNQYRGDFGFDGLKYARDVDDIITYGTSGRVAAYICEALQGVGGIMELAPRSLPAVYSTIRKAGGVCADEVESGFARTGPIFGDLMPMVLCLIS
ncbi:hypothetical protein DH2020_035871 [Rehmannia glutinosa]|uniref:Uncharacterized protein n=1 Tax=Rehmannia glutinosa TaxID=99300 RepID=A0ABR0V7R2_REHGL